ncbi:putative hydrolase protein [Fusarium sporotrichioides]|uniref:Putative hydrolase protein n=1 Tax=Fusarium sporotrichioides TaxID=5514 RepID=A0A395RKC0_FUSSP|nr:putative hydrolase protein [Fusarium sporotrichioides]
MSKRNLLLCFDAFGTLIRPVKPVAQQYAQVARQCGLIDFSDQELQSTLISTIKQESKKNPNFGKETGLGATKWWTNVIHNTFTPLLKNGQALPQDLAPKLLHRFASKDGYETEHDLIKTFKNLKSNTSRHYDQLVVGVITNSDDRIPSILSSLGLNVSPLRYGTDSEARKTKHDTYDIDFHCMSYDVGVEKPDKRIFDAAEFMLAQIISARGGRSLDESKSEVDDWQRVYVGDDYAKDVIGSTNAGWNPVLLDPKDECESIADLKRWRSSPDDESQKKACRIEDHPTETLEGLFKGYDFATIHSLGNLLSWLKNETSSRTAL